MGQGEELKVRGRGVSPYTRSRPHSHTIALYIYKPRNRRTLNAQRWHPSGGDEGSGDEGGDEGGGEGGDAMALY